MIIVYTVNKFNISTYSYTYVYISVLVTFIIILNLQYFF